MKIRSFPLYSFYSHCKLFEKAKRKKNYIANPAIEFSIELYVLFLHNPRLKTILSTWKRKPTKP